MTAIQQATSPLHLFCPFHSSYNSLQALFSAAHLIHTMCKTSLNFLTMQAVHAEEILVPMISWNLDGQRMHADAGDVQQSLTAIRDYSVFQVLVISADI